MVDQELCTLHWVCLFEWQTHWEWDEKQLQAWGHNTRLLLKPLCRQSSLQLRNTPYWRECCWAYTESRMTSTWIQTHQLLDMFLFPMSGKASSAWTLAPTPWIFYYCVCMCSPFYSCAMWMHTCEKAVQGVLGGGCTSVKNSLSPWDTWSFLHLTFSFSNTFIRVVLNRIKNQIKSLSPDLELWLVPVIYWQAAFPGSWAQCTWFHNGNPQAQWQWWRQKRWSPR